MLYALMLFAQDAAKEVAKGNDQGPGSLLGNPMLLVVVLGAMFIFMVILPQQRRDKRQRQTLLTALKKNDEVVTSAGIIGVVSSIKEGGDEVTLKIDDNAKIRVLKSSIARIIPRENKEGA
jgi:preprotein translocase subunit YajC